MCYFGFGTKENQMRRIVELIRAIPKAVKRSFVSAPEPQEPELVFEPGRLYVRTTDGYEMMFLYQRSMDRPFSPQSIARLRGEVGEELWCGWAESLKTARWVNLFAEEVTRRLATDADIRKLLYFWNHRQQSIESWIRHTVLFSRLLEEEKERIQRIASEFTSPIEIAQV